ncbi:hypothetical protein [Yersinia rohdei]|uniref:hypothetical protein n=1 Tax=Yersinia rohdei TaxID=29485 RepID=UPI0011A411A0|nr:hypothetical protein [Yersinia rohdei]
MKTDSRERPATIQALELIAQGFFYKDVTSNNGYDIFVRPARTIFMVNLLHFWSVDLLAHNYHGCAGVYRRGNTSEEMVNMVMWHSIFCAGYRNF